MYTKQIGRFSIVADNKPDLKGYFTPSGTALRQEDIWKDNVFYEQDYFSIYTLQNLRVLDDNQKICTPIIDEIEVQNRGYVATWSAVFWVQGFAIVNDEILFISLGEDTGYLEKKPVFHKLSESNIGSIISLSDFMKTLQSPISQENNSHSPYSDWWNGTKKLSDYMLL